MQIHMMEGSVFSGRFSVEAFTVQTEFGELTVPVSRVVSFTPGLESHPELRKRIARLIQTLGANDASERDAAQRALTGVRSNDPRAARNGPQGTPTRNAGRGSRRFWKSLPTVPRTTRSPRRLNR